MKELNLEVGQKVWSIQLGDCEVCFKDDKLITCTNGNIEKEYYLNGKMFHYDHSPSLFESNPFEPNIKIGTSPTQFKAPINKAELINALFSISSVQWSTHTELSKIATEKLHKLLESI